MAKEQKVLRLILGDQLNYGHSWFEQVDEQTVYLMIEAQEEASYVQHHIQKVVGFFMAMRSFADWVSRNGHQIIYRPLDHPENKPSLAENIKEIIQLHDITTFEYQLPDEYRLDHELDTLANQLDVLVNVVDTEHFLSERSTVEQLFKGKKQYLMETFYRTMRKRYSILMEEDNKTPFGGTWNYDHENRKKLPKKHTLPAPYHFERDVTDLVQMLNEQGIETIGEINPTQFTWPVTREEALEALDHFIRIRLIHFGTFQDAMTERGYLLYHSRLSFALNTKMLHPLEVVKAAETYWEQHQEQISIAQTEGFIRQIIGWREYMRGIYWAKMPTFSLMNYFEHQAKLPAWYWTGQTKMNCLKHAIGQSLQHAYAHHIQRLMITGNFALLVGVHPDEVDDWYLGIYIDAIEWVEITNTRGMSQFADGGIVGTKPYVSSANYIDKMSDYCANCHYDKKKKHGPNACPFNSLYWDFYNRHRDKLSKNPRVGMMYRVWDKYSPEEKEKILNQAARYKNKIDHL